MHYQRDVAIGSIVRAGTVGMVAAVFDATWLQLAWQLQTYRHRVGVGRVVDSDDGPRSSSVARVRRTCVLDPSVGTRKHDGLVTVLVTDEVRRRTVGASCLKDQRGVLVHPDDLPLEVKTVTCGCSHGSSRQRCSHQSALPGMPVEARPGAAPPVRPRDARRLPDTVMRQGTRELVQTPGRSVSVAARCEAGAPSVVMNSAIDDPAAGPTVEFP